MVHKPGTNEVQCFWERADKLSSLLIGKIRSISEMERHM